MKTYLDNDNYSTYGIHFAFENASLAASQLTVNLVSFMLQTYLPNTPRSFAGNDINNCAFGRGCVDGYYCNSVNNICVACDIDCKTCFSASKGDCSLCYPNSPSFYVIPAATTGFYCTSK